MLRDYLLYIKAKSARILEFLGSSFAVFTNIENELLK